MTSEIQTSVRLGERRLCVACRRVMRRGTRAVMQEDGNCHHRWPRSCHLDLCTDVCLEDSDNPNCGGANHLGCGGCCRCLGCERRAAACGGTP